MTEDERTQALREFFERETRRLTERMARFAAEMKTEAILLRDEMETRLPKNDKRIRSSYEHPVNSLVLDAIADNLAQMAKSLPDAEEPPRRSGPIVGALRTAPKGQ